MACVKFWDFIFVKNLADGLGERHKKGIAWKVEKHHLKAGCYLYGDTFV
jgi:hypothetical protein